MKATRDNIDALMSQYGLGDGDDELLLDELVYDLKSKEASEINNSGLRAQVKFIIESSGSFAEAQEMIRSAIHDEI